MKSRNIFKLLVVTALGVSPIACQAEVFLGKQTQRVAAIQQDKTALAPEEQQFAMKLSALHKQIFMMVFTPTLRKEAMALMTIPSDDMDEDTPITADMAVEEVISNHRDMPTTGSGQMAPKSAYPSNTSSKEKASAKPAKESNTTVKKKNYWTS